MRDGLMGDHKGTEATESRIQGAQLRIEPSREETLPIQEAEDFRVQVVMLLWPLCPCGQFPVVTSKPLTLLCKKF